MNQVISPVFDNSVLIVTLIAWTVAQVLKVLIGLVQEKRLNLAAPSDDTQRIQEAHITLLHILCRQTEFLLFSR